MARKKTPLSRMYNLLRYWLNERHSIHLARQREEPWPWTKDEILQRYKFTNVFRELDRVTVWLRERWREPYADHPNLWFAMCVARQINHPPTLEELERLVFAKKWNPERAAAIMDARRDRGEQVYTGAYMIRAESDPSKEWYSWTKQEYMAHIVLGRVWDARKQFAALFANGRQPSLQEVNDWLCTFHGWGGFMAYEVVTDLRHTHYLQKAPDIMTWGNPGPGAKRGLNRLYGRELTHSQPVNVFIEEMVELMGQLRYDRKLMAEIATKLEVRDVEHSLCEFDKYVRVKNGEGRPRAMYSPPPWVEIKKTKR